MDFGKRLNLGAIFGAILVAIFSAVLGNLVEAEENDKSQYTIFSPTPKEKMRELSTDRPDKTESAYTVDAGHFQIETDIVNFTQDKTSDGGVETKTNSFSLMTSNLKAGLTNSMDLQVVLTPHQSDQTDVTGSPREKKSGFGDTTVRIKYNFLGNDGGDIAIALMPFVKFPTNSGDLGNKKIEGGLIFPVGLSLPNDFSMGLMTQINRSKNESDEDFHTEFISSLTLGHDLFGDLGGYLEFYSESSNETDTKWIATADVGLTYGLTPDFQIDVGANFGVTDAADDFNQFVGCSARF